MADVEGKGETGWIKTEAGWKPCRRLIENEGQEISANTSLQRKQTDSYCSMGQPSAIGDKNSKDKPCLSEAMTKLKFTDAVQDIRMFTYICKTVELLTCYQFATLSGTAQNQLLKIAEYAITNVTETQNNIHMVKSLLGNLKDATRKLSMIMGLSAAKRWGKCLETVKKLQARLNKLELKERQDDNKLMLSDLPPEVKMYVLHKMPNHHDILSLGSANKEFYQISSDQGLWKDLVTFHYDEFQINTALSANHDNDIDWKKIYKILYREHGMKEVYGCPLQQCSHCRCVFWKSLGHQCLCEQNDMETKLEFTTILPKKFIEMYNEPLNIPRRRKNGKQIYTYGYGTSALDSNNWQ